MKNIIYVLFVSAIIFFSCTTVSVNEPINFDGSVGGWNGDSVYNTSPDSVRDATHEDSIRLGIIKE